MPRYVELLGQLLEQLFALIAGAYERAPVLVLALSALLVLPAAALISLAAQTGRRRVSRELAFRAVERAPRTEEGAAVNEMPELDTAPGSAPQLQAWLTVEGRSGVPMPLEIEALSQLLHCYTPAQLLGAENCAGDGTHWTVTALQQVVLNKFGVSYQSLTSYRTLLERCDFSYQRTTKQYKSRNESKVMDFEEQLEKNSLTWPRNNQRR